MRHVPLQITKDPDDTINDTIELTFVDANVDGAEDFRFTIVRGAAVDPCLGPNGWQSGEHQFQPVSMQFAGGNLVLSVNSEISAFIDEYTPLEVALPGLGLAGRGAWHVERKALPKVDQKTPIPPKPPNKEPPVEVGFEQTPTGEIQFRGAAPGLPNSLPLGQSVFGLSHDDLAAAYAGLISIDVAAGRARIIQENPERRPRKVRFSLAEDDDQIKISHLDPERSAPEFFGVDESLFRIPSTKIAEAGEGYIEIDPVTGLGKIVPERKKKKDLIAEPDDGRPPPPPPRNPIRVLSTLLVVALVLGIGGAYFWWEDLKQAATELGLLAGPEVSDPPIISVSSLGLREGETDAIRVTLSRAADVEVRVDFESQDVEAVASQDYEPLQGMLTIAAGETEAIIPVEAFQDQEAELNEQFQVVFSNPIGSVFSDAAESLSISILITDVPVTLGPPPVPEPVSEPVEEEPVEEEPVEEEPVEEQQPAALTAEELYEQGMQALNESNFQEARRLLEQAQSEFAHGPSLLELGKALDSLDFIEGGMFRSPDDVRAYLQYYLPACRAGAEGTNEALAELYAELQSRAEAQDILAAEFLRGPLKGLEEGC